MDNRTPRKQPDDARRRIRVSSTSGTSAVMDASSSPAIIAPNPRIAAVQRLSQVTDEQIHDSDPFSRPAPTGVLRAKGRAQRTREHRHPSQRSEPQHAPPSPPSRPRTPRRRAIPLGEDAAADPGPATFLMALGSRPPSFSRKRMSDTVLFAPTPENHALYGTRTILTPKTRKPLFTPDGHLLASVHDGTADPQPPPYYDEPPATPSSSPDGEDVASGYVKLSLPDRGGSLEDMECEANWDMVRRPWVDVKGRREMEERP